MISRNSFARLAPLLLASSSLLGALACSQSGAPMDARAKRAKNGTGDIVIAAAWPWDARKEIRYGEGLQMATEEVNAAGGVNGRKLRIVRSDDHGSVDEGRIVAQRLVGDPDVVAVIGHLQSYVSVPAAAIYDLGGLVMISPTATDPELTSQGYHRVFRTTFTDRTVGRQLAEFAHERGYKKIGIYYIRDTYGRGLANAFEERAAELGLTIAARQSYDPSDQASQQSFAPTLHDWRDRELDALFLAGEVPAAGTFIAEARRQGLTIPIIGGDAMSSPALLASAGAAAEGTIVASIFHHDEPRPEVQRFTAAFIKRFGVEPDAGSAIGYDAVRLLADAMTRAKSSVPDDVARALHETRGFQGVTGRFTFDSTGELVDKPIVKMVVQNGQFKYWSDPPRLAQAVAGR